MCHEVIQSVALLLLAWSHYYHLKKYHRTGPRQGTAP